MATESLARDPEFVRITQEQVSLLSRKGWYHSIQLADGTLIPGLVSVDTLQARLRSFPIPADLTGKRVLDVGAATGWCSFEMERRGAEVVAVDCVEYEEFYIARKLLGSSVEYHILDVDELTPERLGRFDIVLFFGVLYHLRHPLLGLEKICALTTDTAFLESFVTDAHSAPEAGDSACLLEFYESDELGGQIDNWFGPNTRCLMALCRSAGFAQVKLEYFSDRRAGVTCRRHWEPAPTEPAAPPPWIYSAVNNRTGDIYFHPGKDEYICIYCQSKETALRKHDIRVEIDGYGVPTLVLADQGSGGLQANVRVPPALPLGSHVVRIRTVNSGFSNSFEIVMMDEPSSPPRSAYRSREFLPLAEATAPAPVIFAIENSMDRTPVLRGYRQEHLCCYFRSPEADLKKEEILLEVGGCEVPVLFLTDRGSGEWHTNSKLPSALKPGAHPVRVRTTRSPFSEPAEILFQPDL